MYIHKLNLQNCAIWDNNTLKYRKIICSQKYKILKYAQIYYALKQFVFVISFS